MLPPSSSQVIHFRLLVIGCFLSLHATLFISSNHVALKRRRRTTTSNGTTSWISSYNASSSPCNRRTANAVQWNYTGPEWTPPSNGDLTGQHLPNDDFEHDDCEEEYGPQGDAAVKQNGTEIVGRDPLSLRTIYCSIQMALPLILPDRDNPNFYRDLISTTMYAIVNESFTLHGRALQQELIFLRFTPHRSMMRLLQHQLQVDWWLVQTAFETISETSTSVQKTLMLTIDNVVTSGDFFLLVHSEAPEIYAIDVNSGSLSTDVVSTAFFDQIDTEATSRKWVGVGLFCGTWSILVILMTTATSRRKRLEEQELWGAFRLGTDKEVGDMLNMGSNVVGQNSMMKGIDDPLHPNHTVTVTPTITATNTNMS